MALLAARYARIRAADAAQAPPSAAAPLPPSIKNWTGKRTQATRAEVGSRALAASGALPADVLTGQAPRLGVVDWPPGNLRLVAVTVDGTIRAFDRSADVPIALAMAASGAAPGSVQPVSIDGLRYMDGAVAGTNIDQAVGAKRVLAITPFPLASTSEEIKAIATHGGEVFHPVPDEAGRQVIGYETRDLRLRGPAAEDGYRQATAIAERVRAFLIGD